jgi:hypothetical protein
MGHNLGDYPQGYAQVAFLEKTGLFLEKQGNFWRNRAIFGRSEPKAIGRRPEPGAPVEGLRTPAPPLSRLFRDLPFRRLAFAD